MTTALIGCTRCSTDVQDLAAQKVALERLGVAADRIGTDHGLTGTNRARPGLDQALAAVRTGDTLAVPKLDRSGLAELFPVSRPAGHRVLARQRPATQVWRSSPLAAEGHGPPTWVHSPETASLRRHP